MHQAVGVEGKEGLTLMDGVKYQRPPPFPQTFLKQYCDREAWKIPGGQGGLDGAQLSSSEGKEEGETGPPPVRVGGSPSDLATVWCRVGTSSSEGV